MPPNSIIDIHTHIVPDFYNKVFRDSDLSLIHSEPPAWSPHAHLEFMDKSGIRAAILSLANPGVEIEHDPIKSHALARRINEFAARIRDTDPASFGFFGTLPSLFDTDAALDEIAFVLDVLHADGITLYTHYGPENAYLGHPAFQRIWAELDRRSAVVFVHPTSSDNYGQANAVLSQPIADETNDTTRAAFDIITTGTRRRFPRVKIILSHAGGTLPFVAYRAARLLADQPHLFRLINSKPMSAEEILRDARTFYVDLALSTSHIQLEALLDFMPPNHILFGSDFPYARNCAKDFLRDFQTFDMADLVRAGICQETAMILFPRLAEGGTGMITD